MSDARKDVPGDRAIGMDASITRRDFLGSTLLASGAGLLGGLNPAELLAHVENFRAGRCARRLDGVWRRGRVQPLERKYVRGDGFRAQNARRRI